MPRFTHGEGRYHTQDWEKCPDLAGLPAVRPDGLSRPLRQYSRKGQIREDARISRIKPLFCASLWLFPPFHLRHRPRT
jgi:hypothetical protein